MYWNYLVIIICVVAAVFAVIKEYRRKNKSHLGLRFTASVLAVAALAAIALPIFYWGTAATSGNEAILLTDGFRTDSISRYKNDSIYTFDNAIKQRYINAKLITLSQLKNITPPLYRLQLLGYGLTPDELSQINNIPVIFHPDALPERIISASWPEKLKRGQHFVVQGKFNHTGNNPVRLLLKELNTTVDSTTIGEEGNIPFEFTSLPKSSGKIIDRLIAIDGRDTVENDILPLIIEPVKPLRVLVLTSSPGFESKFLKNWLTGQGFEVAVRSNISKDKISTQFVNTPQTSLTQLSGAELDKFDVLIADLSVLKSLNATESASLKQQVTLNGLGVIIKADTAFKTPALLQNDFSVYQPVEKEQQPISIQLLGAKFSSKIPNTGQQFITYKDGIQALVTDAQNRILTGVNIDGAGKIICTTLNETYKWMLAGNKNDYAGFWSLLIAKAAKVAPQTENWSVITPLPTVNSLVTLQIQTGVLPGQIIMDDGHASPAQNPVLPFQWQSTWWPSSSGWHWVKRSGGVENWVYVYKKSDWLGIKAANRIIATQKYLLANASADVTKQIHDKVKIPISKVYFYALLLLCCTFLWAEGKMEAK